MILGIGIDMVEIKRIEAAVGRQLFIDRVFTPREREYCESRGAHRFASYAARFAGKEALAKAFGTGMSGGRWTDIEILPDAAGCPRVHLEGEFAALALRRKVQDIFISLTHTEECAAAQVVLWGEKP